MSNAGPIPYSYICAEYLGDNGSGCIVYIADFRLVAAETEQCTVIVNEL